MTSQSGDRASVADRARYDIGAMTEGDVYKLLSCAVQPRPIAWVSTVSADGTRNLAPFSFFTVASRNPATLVISIGERIGSPGEPKDTLVNVRETGNFVVNIPAADTVEAVTASFATVEPDVDEFTLSGATPIPSHSVSAPSVLESLISLECELLREIDLGTDTLVLGTVTTVTSRPGLLSESLHVDTLEHPFLGRLAGPFYTTSMNRVAQ
ncbi:flavin reductase family protein [Rhodococcus sp. 105337]|uniref:flavin reductase family protein n=1 Tax=Rhodococcus sp. 105337 TaxID=2725310 RepID=UPI00146C9C51|nr:flavin reductase family protein [Rhodococcus sp. 105337]NME77768.1 flavin reductase family protein [Rhodococcus sp. 105337]